MPSDPTTRAIVLYVLSVAAGAAAAGLAVLATQLAGVDPINWRPILAAMIGPIVAGLAASRLPKPEQAGVSAQADALKAMGVAHDEMIVSPTPPASLPNPAYVEQPHG